MEYKQQYKNALEKARELLSCCIDDRDRRTKIYRVEDIESIFPELKESYGEEIRKELIEHIKANKEADYVLFKKFSPDDVIAWLEKQVEKKPHEWHSEDEQNLNATLSYIDDEYLRRWLKDIIHAKYEQCDGCINDKGCVTCVDDNMKEQKVEPKFKVGDCVISNDGTHTYLVKERKRGAYVMLDIGDDEEFSIIIEAADRTGRVWTIQDAKDGDVLALISGQCIFLFDGYDKEYCHYSKLTNSFSPNLNYMGFIQHQFVPATKEQRDLLFHKMKEAGYEWDAEKKELSKQSLKITPRFCVGQLITDDNGTWYEIRNIKCLDDWYYELYDVGEDNTYLELCSIIDEKFRENRFVGEIKKMLGN